MYVSYTGDEPKKWAKFPCFSDFCHFLAFPPFPQSYENKRKWRLLSRVTLFVVVHASAVVRARKNKSWGSTEKNVNDFKNMVAGSIGHG